MKSNKSIIKKSPKQDRERKVLLGLVEHYLKTGKPVGSHTLKDVGFSDLSSATIRNYFAQLEEDGYLTQQHISGGRLPTDLAFKVYATEYIDSNRVSPASQDEIQSLRYNESRELSAYLYHAAEKLTALTKCAVFLSAPRFDQDFINGMKLISLDANRCLCVMLTDFGMVYPEVMHTKTKLSAFSVKRIEAYFHWRITGQNKPDNLEAEEELLAQNFYNELMVRYIVGYSNFRDEDIYRTGLSMLLSHPEFLDPAVLANSLSLLENTHGMRLLLKECMKFDKLKFWIGDDLLPYSSEKPNCAVLALPYKINRQVVGAIGILGPIRMPYRQHFATLRSFVQSISEALTRNVYKYKISMRQPQKRTIDLSNEENHLLTQTNRLLIENKKK